MARPKQDDLTGIEGEGVSQPRVKEIDVAADKYVDIRDKRMAQTQKEVTARTNLVELMRKHNMTTYRYGDHEVVLKTGKDGVKVRNVDGTEEGDPEDDD